MTRENPNFTRSLPNLIFVMLAGGKFFYMIHQGGVSAQCTDPQLVGWCIFQVKLSQYSVLKGWSSEKNTLKKLVHCTKKGGVLSWYTLRSLYIVLISVVKTKRILKELHKTSSLAFFFDNPKGTATQQIPMYICHYLPGPSWSKTFKSRLVKLYKLVH